MIFSPLGCWATVLDSKNDWWHSVTWKKTSQHQIISSHYHAASRYPWSWDDSLAAANRRGVAIELLGDYLIIVDWGFLHGRELYGWLAKKKFSLENWNYLWFVAQHHIFVSVHQVSSRARNAFQGAFCCFKGRFPRDKKNCRNFLYNVILELKE